MEKKLPVVTIAEPEEAARLSGLPLEATVALGDVAGAVKEDCSGSARCGAGGDAPADRRRAHRPDRTQARQAPRLNRPGFLGGSRA